MSFGLTEIITLSALFGGISTLALGLWRLSMARRAQAAMVQPESSDIANLLREGEERLSTMVALMDASHQARLDSLRQDIVAVKTDIDWLAGERMIEQAIIMARDGLPAEQISEDLGLSQDAAHTIATMRRH